MSRRASSPALPIWTMRISRLSFVRSEMRFSQRLDKRITGYPLLRMVA